MSHRIPACWVLTIIEHMLKVITCRAEDKFCIRENSLHCVYCLIFGFSTSISKKSSFLTLNRESSLSTVLHKSFMEVNRSFERWFSSKKAHTPLPFSSGTVPYRTYLPTYLRSSDMSRYKAWSLFSIPVTVLGLISFLSPEFSVLLCSVFRFRFWFPFCLLSFLYFSVQYFGSGSDFLFVSRVFCTSLFSILVPGLISFLSPVFLLCSVFRFRVWFSFLSPEFLVLLCSVFRFWVWFSVCLLSFVLPCSVFRFWVWFSLCLLSFVLPCSIPISVPGLVFFLSPEFSVLLCSVFRFRIWVPFLSRLSFLYFSVQYFRSGPGLFFISSIRIFWKADLDSGNQKTKP